jgi:hypothetical protein
MCKMDTPALAQHASAVAARLYDSDRYVRQLALETMGNVGPATLARNADAVVSRLEDLDCHVRRGALETMRRLAPEALAKHVDAVLSRLEDSDEAVRKVAVTTLGRLPPPALAKHAGAVIAMLQGSNTNRRTKWYFWSVSNTLRKLPRFVTHDIDFSSRTPRRRLRSRLLGRLGWYKCRLHLRVKSLTWYWYALPYRPSGPGHARDVETWGRMVEE